MGGGGVVIFNFLSCFDLATTLEQIERGIGAQLDFGLRNKVAVARVHHTGAFASHGACPMKSAV